MLLPDSASVAADEPCHVCGTTDDEDRLLICDTCDNMFHTYCVGEKSVPRKHAWICPDCNEAELLLAESAFHSEHLLHSQLRCCTCTHKYGLRCLCVGYHEVAVLLVLLLLNPMLCIAALLLRSGAY